MTATPSTSQCAESVTTSLQMPVEMKAALERLRRREGERSVSGIIRTLIEEGFERRAFS